MEEIVLTTGQFRTLLYMTPDPDLYTDETTSLVAVLHRGQPHGHGWRVDLTERDVETALNLFQEHKDTVHTGAAQKSLQLFIQGSLTAQKIWAARRAQADVPRETSEPSDD